MRAILKLYLLLLLLFSIDSYADEIYDISKVTDGSLLQKSSLYIDKESRYSLEELLDSNLLKSYTQSSVNIGISKASIWVMFRLKNSSRERVKKVLILHSSLLEEIELYSEDNLTSALLRGVAHIDKERSRLFPSFPIELEPQESKVYYLKVRSLWRPVDFTLTVKDKELFYKEDQQQQLIKVILLSMIVILMIYGVILGIYTRDKSYLFYSFYLLTLIYQQGSYLGLSQIYLPLDFVLNVEIRMSLTKVALMIISSSLFAITFLKTSTVPWIHRIYQSFILIALFEIIFFNSERFYYFKVVVFTSALLIVFNLMASIILYRRGNRQARLFIVGFGIVFISYTMMMASALGFTSVMQSFRNVLLWGTTLEALILSLAFGDRYAILHEEKVKADQYILDEVKNRERIVKKEVIKKTEELEKVLRTKEFLLQEMHHRVKNNLQIILSIVRLQSDKIVDRGVIENFIDLENRINAVSKTYNLLLPQNNLTAIDMREYIESLMNDIHSTMYPLYDKVEIEIDTDREIMLPLKESVYIGLIINELVTNSYKYAFKERRGKIMVKLYLEDNEIVLMVEDNGVGFSYSEENRESLGLKLIHTLVYHQLRGTMSVPTEHSSKYIIKFTI